MTLRPTRPARKLVRVRRHLAAARPRVLAARYLSAAGVFFVIGGGAALLMRWRLAFPDRPLPLAETLLGWPGGRMPAEAYAQLFTLHGSTMIWLVVVPALTFGLGYVAIGTRRLVGGGWAGLAWWLLLTGAALQTVGLSAGGWTGYAPMAQEAASRWVPYAPDWVSWLRLHSTEADGFPLQSRWPPVALLLVLACTWGTWLHVAASATRSCHALVVAAAVGLPVAAGATVAWQAVASDAQTAWFAAVGLWGVSGSLAAGPVVATGVLARVPRGTRPPAVWGWTAAAGVALVVGPVLLVAMTMNLLDAHGLSTFFGPGVGGRGQPLLHQHLFWFYAHPLVYLMILPAYGVVGHALAGRRGHLVLPRVQNACITAVAVLGFFVWAHHMYRTGLDPASSLVFSFSSMLVSVPTGMLVVCWILTIRANGRPGRSVPRGTLSPGSELKSVPRGTRSADAPAWWAAAAFVSCFLVGGLGGVVLASPAINAHLHDTYFVVAHLHYTLFGGSLFGLIGALYYFWPDLCRRTAHPGLGVAHVVLTYVAFNLTFGLMHVLGVLGMPRRYADPTSVPGFEAYEPFQVVMTAGAAGLGLSQLLLIASLVLGRRAESEQPEPGPGDADVGR